MSKTFQNFIGGTWTETTSLTENRNPSDTNDVVGLYASASDAEVLQAIDAAEAALPKWWDGGIQERHDILKRASDALFKRRNELGELLSREEGKTLAEGIAEVTRASQVFGFFAGEVLRIPGEQVASVRPGITAAVTREPVGVVGIITPWNFPIAIPAWKIAPALAYGNTVVFKPADLVPASAWALVDILREAGLPAGVLNLVMGKERVVGEAILDSPKVRAVSFTGSTAVGHHVAALCAKHLRKVQLEMGGKNPLVIMGDADLDVAVECALNGAFYSTGQRCTASSRLIVEDSIHDQFVAELSERVKALVVGHALDPRTNIGPAVSESQLRQDLDYVGIGETEGAKLAFGGKALDRDTPGYFIEPALFLEATNAMRICREEIFGPVASVIRVRDYDEAVAVANDTEFGLSSGICTTSLRYASHFQKHSGAGMVMVNLPTAGVDYHVPFGGRRASSLGSREQGRYAVEFYTNVKTAYANPQL